MKARKLKKLASVALGVGLLNIAYANSNENCTIIEEPGVLFQFFNSITNHKGGIKPQLEKSRCMAQQDLTQDKSYVDSMLTDKEFRSTLKTSNVTRADFSDVTEIKYSDETNSRKAKQMDNTGLFDRKTELDVIEGYKNIKVK